MIFSALRCRNQAHKILYSSISSNSYPLTNADAGVVPFANTRRNFSDNNKATKGQKVIIDVEYGNTDADDDDGNKNKTNKKSKETIDVSKFTQEIEIRMPDMGEGEGKVVVD